MSKRVLLLTFGIESQSYQAFSEIKKLHVARAIKGDQMAVVTHTNDGNHQFKIDDFIDFTGNNNASTGGMIGMLVGVLVSPLAVLLGWFAGGMIGATRDAKEIKDAQSVFESVISQIGVGDTAVILIVEEDDNRPLNQLVMNQLGGRITRLDYAEVEEEIQRAKEVEDQAQKAAQETWADTHPTDRHEEK
ncbi:DUF1269 domain-containing protein [Enterococcus sp. JM4C]|uniref:DUF1269 domain-containing protein n=1 Tax=Candidatus Enterococcus huntleyi TaxID=1857217 RepID=UPI00137B15C5|nr:DUF1269 domain-containing protein [Enterococcus sp. JM4C]KAF1296949.1 DUF1269 domain-containing protein [Enterococcus sp. JM4C]